MPFLTGLQVCWLYRNFQSTHSLKRCDICRRQNGHPDILRSNHIPYGSKSIPMLLLFPTLSISPFYYVIIPFSLSSFLQGFCSMNFFDPFFTRNFEALQTLNILNHANHNYCQIDFSLSTNSSSFLITIIHCSDLWEN